MDDTTHGQRVQRPAREAQQEEALTHEVRFADGGRLLCKVAGGFQASHVAILVSQDTDRVIVVRDRATGAERVFGA